MPMRDLDVAPHERLRIGIRIGLGKTGRAPCACDQVTIDAGGLGHLCQRQSLAVPPQRERRCDHGETVVLGRDEIVERGAESDEVLEQREPFGRVRGIGIVETGRLQLGGTGPIVCHAASSRPGDYGRPDSSQPCRLTIETAEVCGRARSGRNIGVEWEDN
jgi:hypothetical protein